MKHHDPGKPCTCFSGKRFDECCRPLLRGERDAADPVALMRSRFSAFALDNAAYLWKTLHSRHPEKQKPEADVLRSMRRASRQHEYLGLQILDSAGPRVLFLATLSRGVSFVERSEFAQEDGAWRYLSGELRPATPGDESLTLATFTPSAIIE
jgi:SEC-C motif-containing protein